MSKKHNVFLVLAATLCLLSGCSIDKESQPIEDVHHLDGQNIGVMLAWGPDYALTGRDDLKLTRYNRVADMIMALCYHRIDAIAIEDAFSPEILSSVSGIRKLEDPVAEDGLVAITATDQNALLEEFNAFIAEFQNTEDYKDLLKRSRDPDGYDYKVVPLAEGDKVLKVGITDDNYPFTYIDFQTKEYAGIDVEVLRHFANKYGYKIEFSGGTWEAMSMDISYKNVDIALSGISDLYRDDYVLADTALVSDVYLPVNIVLIEVEDLDALKIISAIEY